MRLLSPAGAQYCIYCRYAFDEEKKRAPWRTYALIAVAILAVFLAVLVAALLLGILPGEPTPASPAADAARAGAAALVSPTAAHLNANLSAERTPMPINQSVGARPTPSLRANNSTTATVTPVPNGTLSRYIQNLEGSGGGSGGRSPGGHLGSAVLSVRGGR